MRDQLLKDGYNLDLESDNEDLDLIPPKPQSAYSGLGGLCSCSGESCVISWQPYDLSQVCPRSWVL